MPITTHDEEAKFYEDPDHWEHVIESLFVKAVERAGFTAIRPAAQGSHLIHGQIISHLSNADLVLCDLSRHNPNVFFELGVRTSLNLPVALVRDDHTSLPFDTSGINTHIYSSSLRGWEIEDEQERLVRHISDSASSCSGQNPLWRHFGLTIKANEPDANESPLEAKVDLLTDSVAQLRHIYFNEQNARELEARNASSIAYRELINEREGGWFGGVGNENRKKRPDLTGFMKEADHYIGLMSLPVVLDYHTANSVIATWGGSPSSPEHLNILDKLAAKNGIKLIFKIPPSESDVLSEKGQQVNEFRATE
ncbi:MULTISPECIES: hypothetical protein [unclassified Dietzia]|uniref:hypothetical protein n=1 Tax=unclassified Dietzia TaxID=2617939 RepID=UPI0015FBDAB6|nr:MULTISPECIES: hypothetical protein [unclassified Dietzia]MBB1023373.1 hypothetical protein [Dietzia sp. DQ12-76]MBB1029284.1 hypothetical protein [Dietzia sp. DQ11-38-2]